MLTKCCDGGDCSPQAHQADEEEAGVLHHVDYGLNESENISDARLIGWGLRNAERRCDGCGAMLWYEQASDVEERKDSWARDEVNKHPDGR